jgi:cell division protease FtsH
MISRLAIMMGGRVAEEIIFGADHVTSGASSDIDAATKLARAMVTRWGFSKKLGVVAYGENQDEVFLGHSVARQQNVSEATAQIIDEEVKRLVQEAWDEANRILTEKVDQLHKLAQGLLEYETLSGDEIKDLLDNDIKPNREDEVEPPAAGPAVSVPVTPVPKAEPKMPPGAMPQPA